MFTSPEKEGGILGDPICVQGSSREVRGQKSAFLGDVLDIEADGRTLWRGVGKSGELSQRSLRARRFH